MLSQEFLLLPDTWSISREVGTEKGFNCEEQRF